MRLHELQFVQRLRKLAAAPNRSRRAGPLRVREGIGDDCAVLATGGANDLLVTTDLFIEDVHFRRNWQSPHSVGHKVLTRGLSDIAAMGGIPKLAFLSLALPRTTTQKWMDNFLDGLLTLAKKHRVVLAGGDTGSSPDGFTADIIVIGEAPANRSVLRSGARAGDEIWVSGRLGGAAAELRSLRSNRNAARQTSRRKGSVSNPYFYPQARLGVGEYLRESGLTSAMMDISDGLSIDLLRLTRASNVGAVADAAAIPSHPGATPADALHGGDDFELLFTVPRAKAGKIPKAINGVPLRRIGRITRERGVRIIKNGVERPLPTRGYQHF